ACSVAARIRFPSGSDFSKAQHRWSAGIACGHGCRSIFGLPGNLFEAPDEERPRQCPCEGDESRETKCNGEAAGPVDHEACQGRTNHTGKIREGILQTDPPARGARPGKYLG